VFGPSCFGLDVAFNPVELRGDLVTTP
jgi:hypothetical protein